VFSVAIDAFRMNWDWEESIIKNGWSWIAVDDLFVWDGAHARLAFTNSDFELGIRSAPCAGATEVPAQGQPPGVWFELIGAIDRPKHQAEVQRAASEGPSH